MKNRLLLFIFGWCVLLSSCIDSDNEVEYIPSKDCEITSFALGSDSLPIINGVKFTIDQVNGRIFNMDSLPYGTTLDTKFNCQIAFAGTVVECKIMQEATGDTVVWNERKTLNFSKPVKLVTKAWDGKTTKGYMAQVNIHTVDPDSMIWNCYAKGVTGLTVKNEKVLTFEEEGKEEELFYMFVESQQPEDPYYLYTSPVSDVKQWTKQEITGLPLGKIILSQIIIYQKHFYAVSSVGDLYISSNGINWAKVENTPSILALLGVVDANNRIVSSSQNSVLSVIAEKEGVKYFSCLTDKGKWLPETEEERVLVPEEFPIKGFANISFYAMYCARLSLVGGVMQKGGISNKTWGTTDGLNWEDLTLGEMTTPFDGIEGASVVEYDNLKGEENKFFMFGGFDEKGNPSTTIYRSIDAGMSWLMADTLVLTSTKLIARGEMSAYVDKDNFVYLFGGKINKNKDAVDEIWRGRINRLGFDFVPLK